MKTSARFTRVSRRRFPPDDVLDDLVHRILLCVSPSRIILFGSAARGEMRQGSDLDVLVVTPDGSPCRDIARAIYRSMRGFPLSKDILVVTDSDVRDSAHSQATVIGAAMAEGKDILHATATPR